MTHFYCEEIPLRDMAINRDALVVDCYCLKKHRGYWNLRFFRSHDWKIFGIYERIDDKECIVSAETL